MCVSCRLCVLVLAFFLLITPSVVLGVLLFGLYGSSIDRLGVPDGRWVQGDRGLVGSGVPMLSRPSALRVLVGLRPAGPGGVRSCRLPMVWNLVGLQRRLWGFLDPARGLWGPPAGAGSWPEWSGWPDIVFKVVAAVP